MVATRRREEGKARLGCLFVLFVLASAVYVLRDLPGVYLRYYQMQDEVSSQASFAPGLTDDAIRQRLAARADTLDVPLGPKQWVIKRTKQNIVIEGEYEDSVVVEVLTWRHVLYFHLKPHAASEL